IREELPYNEQAHIYHQLAPIKDKRARDREEIPTTIQSSINGLDPLSSIDLDLITPSQDAVPYGSNDYKPARSRYEQDLERKLKSLSLNHPDLIVSYNNIGEVYHKMGN
ncbi:unnamed protein product, partial [Adineta ricciae]